MRLFDIFIRPYYQANYKGNIKKILTYVKYYTSFRIVKKDGKWMQKPRYEEPFYDAMTFDINNTCNLRCRFCFNDFEQKACYMSEEVYLKILSLFPLIRPLKSLGGQESFFHAFMSRP